MVEAALAVPVRMDAGGLGEDVGPYDGGIVSDALAGEVLHHLAQPGKVGLVDPDDKAELVAQIDRHLRQGGIAGPLAQAVDRAMHRRRARLGGGQYVGGGQAIVVMGVEVEFEPGEAPDHVPHGERDPLRGHHPQGIRQHEMGDTAARQVLHQAIDIARVILVAIGPVLEIQIDLESLA